MNLVYNEQRNFCNFSFYPSFFDAEVISQIANSYFWKLWIFQVQKQYDTVKTFIKLDIPYISSCLNISNILILFITFYFYKKRYITFVGEKAKQKLFLLVVIHYYQFLNFFVQQLNNSLKLMLWCLNLLMCLLKYEITNVKEIKNIFLNLNDFTLLFNF